MASSSIPVLDLQSFLHGSSTQQQQFVSTLGHGLETIGFFALENHCIAPGLIQSAYGAAADFFKLPDVIKKGYEQPGINGQRGFTRFAQEHAKDSAVPDLKEFWHVGRDTIAPNVWPDEPEAFREAVAWLYHALDHTALMLLRALT